MTPTSTNLITHRNNAKDAAIIFVHGFSGDPQKTWGKFPTFLENDASMKEWDIYSLGYSTRLNFDFAGIWSADPEIDKIAALLSTNANSSELGRYKPLAFVAHSMGGLAVQRAIVNDSKLTARTSHLFLFGTPSNGLTKASLFARIKKQVRDMASGSAFINDLREQWSRQFSKKHKKSLPFKFVVVAGERDEFVPQESSMGVFSKEEFPDAQIAVVPGNHLEIVKPESANDLNVQVVLKGITGAAAPAGPWNSARVAVESRDFHSAVNSLEPNKDKLDDAALVRLALALEGVGRQEDAIKVLEERGRSDTDAMGVLAGRLKRRWLVERQDADARKALELYTRAFVRSEAEGNSEQAYYHGVNVAFMYLVYEDNMKAARDMAAKVLVHCRKAVDDGEIPKNKKWRLATEGEARLLLGETEAATKSYREAVDTKPAPRELDSMYQQAVLVAACIGDELTAKKLESIFRGGNT